MYLNYFGFRELPFELTANPRFLWLAARHREALANVQYGLVNQKSLTVLLGTAGTGKTTLLRAAIESDRCRHVRCVHVVTAALSAQDFLQTVAKEFGLSSRAFLSRPDLLSELRDLLAARRQGGQISALIIDEAQRLTDEVLEEIRLLTNLETSDTKLLSLVLAGHPELAARLNEPSLAQLKQRIVMRAEITPFELPETASYIASRVGTAGAAASTLFTRESVMLIHELSRGIARTINVVCDNALLTSYGSGQPLVTRQIIEQVARDFDLSTPDSQRSGGTTANMLPLQFQANRTQQAEPEHERHEEPTERKRRFLLFGS